MPKYRCEGCKRTDMHPDNIVHLDINDEPCGPVRPVAQDIVWEGDEARLGDVVGKVFKISLDQWGYEVWRKPEEENWDCGTSYREPVIRAACEAAMRVLAGEA
jgi:hypothetical protein